MGADEVGGEPEVTVEDVPDNIETGFSDPDPGPGILNIIKFNLMVYFSNPWALLILAFLLYKLYKHVKPILTEPLLDRYYSYKEHREQQEEAAKYKKNPDEYRTKMEQMEAARMRLQQRYDVDALKAEEKRVEDEEKRREQEIQEWEDHLAGKGYKNRANRNCDKEREALEQQARVKGKKGFKPDYNPLMGSGGGGGYRPAPRRSQTGGG